MLTAHSTIAQSIINPSTKLFHRNSPPKMHLTERPLTTQIKISKENKTNNSALWKSFGCAPFKNSKLTHNRVDLHIMCVLLPLKLPCQLRKVSPLNEQGTRKNQTMQTAKLQIARHVTMYDNNSSFCLHILFLYLVCEIEKNKHLYGFF